MKTKTQQLLELARRHLGSNVQVEYKFGGVNSGWYLNKGDHSTCIGENFETANQRIRDILARKSILTVEGRLAESWKTWENSFREESDFVTFDNTAFSQFIPQPERPQRLSRYHRVAGIIDWSKLKRLNLNGINRHEHNYLRGLKKLERSWDEWESSFEVDGEIVNLPRSKLLSETRQLQELLQCHFFGLNAYCAEYKSDGWYLTKGTHSSYIGENFDAAHKWVCEVLTLRSRFLQGPGPNRHEHNYLLKLAQRHFEHIQIEYKPTRLRSGWYITKNEHSYCIGKNTFDAILWFHKVPNLIQAPTNPWQGYVDHTVINQLNGITISPFNFNVNNFQEIINFYRNIGKFDTGLVLLLWMLGVPLKSRLGYYPNFILSGNKGSGRIIDLLSKQLHRPRKFIQYPDFRTDLIVLDDMFVSFSRKINNPPVPTLVSGNRELLDFFKSITDIFNNAIEIEYLPNRRYVEENIHQWPPQLIWPKQQIKNWIQFLITLPQRDIETVLDSISLPLHVKVIILVWRLLCQFIGLNDPQLERNITDSITATLQRQESCHAA